MKKIVITISFIVICTSIYAFDFTGVWVLNRFSFNEEDLFLNSYSWGDGKRPKNAQTFSIDKGEEGNFIDIQGFGKHKVLDIIKEDDNYEIVFQLSKNADYGKMIIKVLNEYEICIVSIDNTTFLPVGNGNRYFRISGPDDVNKIKTPFFGKIKKNTRIYWNDVILGSLEMGMCVEILGISNQDDYTLPFSDKYFFVKIDDKYVNDYNDDFYSGQGLHKKDPVTYGFIQGKFIQIGNDRSIQ